MARDAKVNIPRLGRMLNVTQTLAVSGGLDHKSSADLLALDRLLARVTGHRYAQYPSNDTCALCGQPGWMHSDVGRCP